MSFSQVVTFECYVKSLRQSNCNKDKGKIVSDLSNIIYRVLAHVRAYVLNGRDNYAHKQILLYTYLSS